MDLAVLNVRVADQNVTATQRQVETLDKAFTRTEATIISVNQALALVSRTANVIQRVSQTVIGAAAEQQASVNGLNQALRSSDQFTAAYSQRLRGLAGEFQRTTTVASGVTIATEQQLIAFGATEDKIRRLTEATLDLSEGTGRDLTGATFAMGKAVAGEFGTLGRYGVFVDENAKRTVKLEQALAQIERRFGGQARAAVDTYNGRIAQLNNAFSEVFESLGNVIVKSDAFYSGSRRLIDAVFDTALGVDNWREKNQGLIDQRIDAFFEKAIGLVERFPSALDKAGSAAKTAAAGLDTIKGSFDGLLEAWNGLPEGLRQILVFTIVGGVVAKKLAPGLLGLSGSGGFLAGAGTAAGAAVTGVTALGVAGVTAAGAAGVGTAKVIQRVIADEEIKREAQRLADIRFGKGELGVSRFDLVSGRQRDRLLADAQRQLEDDPNGIKTTRQRERLFQQRSRVEQQASETADAAAQARGIPGEDATAQVEEYNRVMQEKAARDREAAEASKEAAKRTAELIEQIDKGYLSQTEANAQIDKLTGLQREGRISAEEYAAAVAEITQQLEEQDPLLQAWRDHQEEVRKKLEETTEAAKDQAKSLVESLRTPREAMEEAIRVAKELHGQKFIDDTTLNRAVARAKKDFRDLEDGAASSLESIENAIQNVGGTLTDTLTKALRTGKADVKEFVNSFLDDLARLAVQETITRPLFTPIVKALRNADAGNTDVDLGGTPSGASADKAVAAWTEAANTVGSRFDAVISGVGAGFSGVINNLGGTLGSILVGLFSGGSKFSIGGLFKAIGGGALQGVLGAAGNALSGYLGGSPGLSAAELGNYADLGGRIGQPNVGPPVGSLQQAGRTRFATGGRVPRDMLAYVEAGEEIWTLEDQRARSRGGGGRRGGGDRIQLSVPVQIVVQSFAPAEEQSAIMRQMPAIEAALIRRIERGGRMAQAVRRRER